MKKIYFAAFLAGLLTPLAVVATDNAGTEFAQGLKEYYAENYALTGLDIQEQNGSFVINVPEVEARDISFDAEGNLQEFVDKIPPYTLTATASGTFADFPRYKISTDSLNAFRSEMYNLFMLNHVNAGSFWKEIYFVPKLQFMSSTALNISDITFVYIDAQTGLKDEIASLKSFELKNNAEATEKELVYDAFWQASDFKFKNPFLTASVPNATNRATIVYDINEHTDYKHLLTDAVAIKKTASIFNAENVLLSVLGNYNINYSIRATGKSNRDDAAGIINISGHSDIHDIKVYDLADFSLQKIKMRYRFDDINIAQIKKLQDLQARILEEQQSILENTDSGNSSEPNSPAPEELTAQDRQIITEVGSIVDEISKTAQLKIQLDINFAEGDIVYMMALKKSGKFVIGKGEFKFYNLDKIIPDYKKQCETERLRNPDSIPESCMKAGMSGMFDEYIDKTKRTADDKGRTVDVVNITFNESGVFVNSNRVADALEFDINELVAAALAKDTNASPDNISTDDNQ